MLSSSKYIRKPTVPHFDIIGCALVVAGVLLLCLAYAFGLTRHNWIMVIALLLEFAGCVAFYLKMRG